MKKVTLRESTAEDLPFLYDVAVRAMEPILKLSNRPNPTFEEYKERYNVKDESEKIQVVQYEGKDVGRLRVVRSAESIYIGGFQILPELQNMGIGTEVMRDLMKESDDTKIPITLEVSNSNPKARQFYDRLGFKFVKSEGNESVLQYDPINNI